MHYVILGRELFNGNWYVKLQTSGSANINLLFMRDQVNSQLPAHYCWHGYLPSHSWTHLVHAKKNKNDCLWIIVTVEPQLWINSGEFSTTPVTCVHEVDKSSSQVAIVFKNRSMKNSKEKIPDRLVDSCKHLSVNRMAAGSAMKFFLLSTNSLNTPCPTEKLPIFKYIKGKI